MGADSDIEPPDISDSEDEEDLQPAVGEFHNESENEGSDVVGHSDIEPPDISDSEDEEDLQPAVGEFHNESENEGSDMVGHSDVEPPDISDSEDEEDWQPAVEEFHNESENEGSDMVGHSDIEPPDISDSEDEEDLQPAVHRESDSEETSPLAAEMHHENGALVSPSPGHSSGADSDSEVEVIEVRKPAAVDKRNPCNSDSESEVEVIEVQKPAVAARQNADNSDIEVRLAVVSHAANRTSRPSTSVCSTESYDGYSEMHVAHVPAKQRAMSEPEKKPAAKKSNRRAAHSSERRSPAGCDSDSDDEKPQLIRKQSTNRAKKPRVKTVTPPKPVAKKHQESSSTDSAGSDGSNESSSERVGEHSTKLGECDYNGDSYKVLPPARKKIKSSAKRLTHPKPKHSSSDESESCEGLAAPSAVRHSTMPEVKERKLFEDSDSDSSNDMDNGEPVEQIDYGSNFRYSFSPSSEETSDEEWVRQSCRGNRRGGSKANKKSNKKSNKKPKAKRRAKKKLEEEEFVVEAILDQKINPDGAFDFEISYKIRWEGYSEAEDSWTEPEDMSAGVLFRAFSMFPCMIETLFGEVEDEYKFKEEDLERCLDFYDDWKKREPKEAKQYHFVEVKTDREHLRVGTWYMSDDGEPLLVARLNSQDRIAKCLAFMPSTGTPFDQDGQEELFFYKAVSVDFSLLEKPLDKPVPTSQWCYISSSGPEFTLYSNREKRIPSQAHFYHDIKPTVLVLGAGSVGMSCGYEEEGWNVAWQVEIDRNAADSLRRNFSEESKGSRKLFVEKIQSFLSNVEKGEGQYDFRDENGVEQKVDHIHLSFPCEDNSVNEIRPMMQGFVDCVEKFKPKSGMFDSTIFPDSAENILVTPEKIEILQTMMMTLKSMSYQMQLMILNASDYGDPIETKRLILWFVEETMYIPIRPWATHGEGLLNEKVTAEEALGWLEDVQPCEFGSVKIDEEHIYNHCQPQNPPAEADIALDRNKPAPDITGRSTPIHFSQKRLVTVRECMCLKSFDEQYEIHGSEEQQMKVVTDAMPCKMAIHLARACARPYGLP